MTIFKRKIYDKMLHWKEHFGGKYALLIEGPRRVGKSTIAEEFAKNEYDEYVIIDFAAADESILELFDHINDLERFFLGLQTLTKSLPHRRSVIIFDEVQFCPKARQAIKHLVKDGRYDYIETGSLISIKKNTANILIPSEEHQIDMHPMDFEEFLWAIGKKGTFDLIRYSYERQEALGEAVNRRIMYDFRLYMLVGGMPQAVNAYLDAKDFAVVDAVKRNILSLYEADFRKVDPYGRASTFFKHIPAELSRETSRFMAGSVIEGTRPSRLGEVFADMADSRTVDIAYNACDPAPGMGLFADYDNFKMYLADTGLFITLAFADKSFADNSLYPKLLVDKVPANLGYVFENAVAQQLASAGHKLFYHVFKEDGKSYEVDFLIRKGTKICPIEVKSSGYKSHKSLDRFVAKYHDRIGGKYILYTKDLQREGDVAYLPIYMAALL